MKKYIVPSVNECLEYLKNKYSQTFEVEKEKGFYRPSDYILGFFVSVNGYDWPAFVREEVIGEEKIFRDNFVAVRFMEKTGALFNRIVKEAFSEFKVIYEPSANVLHEDYDLNMSFEKFISDIRTGLEFDILVPPEITDSDREEKLMELYHSFCKEKVNVSFGIRYFADEKQYVDTNSHKQLFLIRRMLRSSVSLRMDENFGVRIIIRG